MFKNTGENSKLHKVLNKVSIPKSVHINETIMIRELERLKKYEALEKYSFKRFLQRRSDIELEKMYWTVVGFIGLEFRLQERKTKFESALNKKLRKTSRAFYYKSFWIGNCNTDLFFPRYKLIVEIDGDVHDRQFKMLKDEFRDDLFKDLGIMVTHISNENISQFQENLVKGIRSKEIKQIDTRAKRRLMRKIYVETILRLSTHLGRYYQLLN